MVVEELITLIGADISPDAIPKIEGFSKVLEGAAYGLVAAVAAIEAAVLAASAAMVGIGVKMAADMEMTTAEITTMMGGNEKQAKALIGTIREFANVTPYETAPLIDNAKTMMSMGIAAGDTVKYMKLIGDVAGGNQEKMSRFVYNFSQIKSLGKLQGEDLKEFARGGFNPLKSLTEDRTGRAFTREELEEKVKKGIMTQETFNKVVGKTAGQLQEMSSKGEIGFQQMVDGFKMATSEGGLFFGNLERMSQKILGRWSTMVDAVKTNLLDLGNKFLPLVGRWLDAIAKVVEYIGPLWVEIIDQFRIFAENMGENSVEDWGQTIIIILETLIETAFDLLYAFIMVFSGLKAGFQGLYIFVSPLLKLMANALWHSILWPLELVIAAFAKLAGLAGMSGMEKSLSGLSDALLSFPTKVVEGFGDLIGANEEGLAKSITQTKMAWDMIGKEYKPHVQKPPKFEQNNNIVNNVTIDPKADPTGRTSLHMKGLKEAVRSAFTIEQMQILSMAKG